MDSVMWRGLAVRTRCVDSDAVCHPRTGAPVRAERGMRTGLGGSRWRGHAVAGACAIILSACAGFDSESDDLVRGEEARRFGEEAEARLLDLWIGAERAGWVQSTYLTDDTAVLAAEARASVIEATMELADEVGRFDSVMLPGETRRKRDLLVTSVDLPAPADPSLQNELSILTAELEAMYGRGQYCPGGQSECLSLPEMERQLAEARDTDELVELWTGWRLVSPAMRDQYTRFVELANAGARDLGFNDLGALWRASYELPPGQLIAELERLWAEVRPLYEALHCHVRAGLADNYGSALVPGDEPIPAHLLGNMWGQSWGNIYDLVATSEREPGFDLTERLVANGVDSVELVRIGERFFSSLGFEPLPETFWTRSLFVQPRDRDVVCHASAWDIDFASDVRIKMCIDVNDEDFATVHHELGHNYYQRAYQAQSPVFRAGANKAFHEGIGDTIALSLTPAYLRDIGLLNRGSSSEDEVGGLLKLALDKVAFLPFGLMVDQWRWKVFSGDIRAEEYNEEWWSLRRAYQGVRAPVPRSEADFDPGAKYHVPANVSYTRYFLAHILQFQFHRALCAVAGREGPLHQCSIFGSAEAGRQLRTTLELGASRPWPDALELLTGSRELDSSALVDYFAPLQAWLDEQNAGRSCGW